MDHRAKGLLLGLGAYASWGLLSPVGDRLLDTYRPLELNAVRFTLALAILGPWFGWRGLREGARLAVRPGLFFANLLANASLTLFLYAMVLLEPTHATLGFYTAPLWTAALAAVLLGERIGRWFPAAVAALLAGGYLALFGWAAPAGASGKGLLLAVASGLVWALYTVMLRRAAPEVPPKPLVATAFLHGTAYFVLLAVLVEGSPSLQGRVPDHLWLALYVAVPTVASFLLFNLASRWAPAADLNILVGAELAFTAVFAWILFQQAFDAVQVTGLAIVIVAVGAYLAHQARAGRPVGV